MRLLLDIGNTHTHLGLADDRRVIRTAQVPTRSWLAPRAGRALRAFTGSCSIRSCSICSVVPRVTPRVAQWARRLCGHAPFELTWQTIPGLGIRYPHPQTIGADRLANALAARHHYGCPAIVIDFGTAVTFDVVDPGGCYIGGVIAPGLAAMTEYLHDRTALLPRIAIRDVPRAIGRSTREAMQIGAVHGYRGLIRELLRQIRLELGCRRPRVIATGGCAALIARGLPEIQAVDPRLTLEGLRLATPAGGEE